MRGPIPWIAAAGGVLLVIIVVALIGGRDKRDESVSAGEWAQSVCGAVGVWRGDLEAIVEDIRTPPSAGATGTEEPQSETPQGRTGFIRSGLERAVQSADTMVEGIDRAGTPETSQGEQAAQQVSDWADSAHEALENAEDSLDEEADTIGDSIAQLASAAGAIRVTLAEGVRTLADVARLDPELGQALQASSTCQQLREEANA
jgi:hypothetical protein